MAPIAVVVGFVAGGVASITGFGIGSLLTPLLAIRLGMQLAVAVVAVPHFAGTALRLWRLRAHVDRRVLGRIPERTFRVAVSSVIPLLGVGLLLGVGR